MKVKTLILVIALLSVVSFFLNAGLVWVVCWAFGWTWSWKICLAVWALEWMLSLTFHKSGRAE